MWSTRKGVISALEAMFFYLDFRRRDHSNPFHGWTNGNRSGVFYLSIDPILKVSDPFSGQPDMMQRMTGLIQVGRTF